ncbi:MAG: formylglycine-generating enzyme family protein [Bacteroidales bacterium]|nr:formylglycine-generating enzyme family protein [Bacteroidales bacterium]
MNLWRRSRKAWSRMVCMLALSAVPAGLRAEGDAEAFVGVYDTLRFTWQVEANANGKISSKNFYIAGTPDGQFMLYWGDGESELLQTNGARAYKSHTYASVGTYEVLVCCLPFSVNEGDTYVETAFGKSFDMVRVEGGMFAMGGTADQGDDYDDRYSDERPVHDVTLSNFYIGKYEVTQAQWYAVMGTTIEEQKAKAYDALDGHMYGVGDDYPMYYVNYDEAQAFCEKLSAQTGKRYRLPTEAEWEYAARGGHYPDGTAYAGSNDLGEVAWWQDNSENATHPVGQKKANGLGLYDMSGNVWEICSDWFNNSYYQTCYDNPPTVNPQGPSKQSTQGHVVRGGAFYQVTMGVGAAKQCRVSLRYATNVREKNLGFRVVCEERAGGAGITELRLYKGSKGIDLVSLDVSGCSALEELQCQNNALGALDVTPTPAFEEFDFLSV